MLSHLQRSRAAWRERACESRWCRCCTLFTVVVLACCGALGSWKGTLPMLVPACLSSSRFEVAVVWRCRAWWWALLAAVGHCRSMRLCGVVHVCRSACTGLSHGALSCTSSPVSLSSSLLLCVGGTEWSRTRRDALWCFFSLSVTCLSALVATHAHRDSDWFDPHACALVDHIS